ncbi:efflux RND transporter periplasmic adaptor subunit [Stratiformator vulcanicus]|nr:efflux RND transporter periplasmic adaptor subunit [Stratiformator vulcanicus]
MRSIGLTGDALQNVELTTFRRSISVPAVIAERPGHSRVTIATPLTGVIEKVHVLEGQAVEPGTLMFEVRLTHEDLVRTQTEFLRTLGELDVEQREINRLEVVTRSGAVARKLLLESEYEQAKLRAIRDAQRESLRLHGLSEKQVTQIEDSRRLLKELQIFAPAIDGHGAEKFDFADSRPASEGVESIPKIRTAALSESVHFGPLVLKTMRIQPGEAVQAGQTLCDLADYDLLYIEGHAFEQDVAAIRAIAGQGWPVEAVFENAGREREIIHDLPFAYLANEVDRDERTLKFYVRLPNEITADRSVDGKRYIEWRYVPGRRIELRVPIEQWENQIVLPADAVARDGVESFVYRQEGDEFEQIPVTVMFRDQMTVVIANDGSINPGDIVAGLGAHQLHLAIENQSGGGVDPHAGHSH